MVTFSRIFTTSFSSDLLPVIVQKDQNKINLISNWVYLNAKAEHTVYSHFQWDRQLIIRRKLSTNSLKNRKAKY